MYRWSISVLAVDIASQPMKPNEPYPSISKFTSWCERE